jgi:zinc protease
MSSVEFQRRKDQRIATALTAEADPASTRSVALRRVVFGQGYGALPADGLRSTLKGLEVKDVVDQYRAAVVPQGASLIVVGATDRATVQAELERAFGGWAGAAKVAFQAVDSNQPERAVYFVDHPGASQSAIAVAMRSESAQAPDLFESEVYNWTVGGAFTSRINLNLREAKGFTYGARSGFYRWSQAGFFSVGALVKAPNTRESVDEIFKDLAAAHRGRPITAQEANEARAGLLLGFPSEFESVSAVSAKVTELAMIARPATWYSDWPRRVEAVTDAAVGRVAERASHREAYVVVVSGDYASVGPTFESIGLPVVRLDAQGNRLPPPKK